MNKATAQQGLLMAWLGLVVVQIARAAGGGRGFQFPEPRLVIAPAVIYSGLSLLAMVSPELAVALGVGIDVAAVISPGVMTATEGTMLRVVGVSGKKQSSGNGQYSGQPFTQGPPFTVSGTVYPGGSTVGPTNPTNPGNVGMFFP